ncbi:hypothetical protein HYQ45_000018 [Verticillium longisporum]|uniref:Mediator of RNA polymerase II transcription subunit 9 n=5 Tax=Verticillium TaxID=1036719 RepID=G2WSS5_VERDV|nr:uncharacterized protein VDAG_00856 [Verticillium dahliae VdLs.17]XP_028498529.1 uncharacterized protein D7B24_008061 [Verticillium nonalfalfae]KAF3348807.1 hypothetical protein VdG2_03689 [Verticillium dahliae VDG2]KAF3357651.1 hypothetical protein VdG1_05754 [Verticillium dahliae VDG1]KAG7102501.1 hypothetical protein HYQ44_018311 [Verticillium longisporum]KAH6701734.1 RNA polymerase II transcription mediator complex subunit 9-domain-containing protein [Verticillium dahliae]EGY17174.1 hyp
MASTPHPLALPPTLSPDALDTLTELTTILTRLRAAVHASNPSANAGGITGATPLPTGATPNPLGASPGGTNAMTLRELSTQTDALKHKLQRARTQLKSLPDMERDIEEQEDEVRQVEERIRVQREMLERLRERGVQFGKDGEKMETD